MSPGFIPYRTDDGPNAADDAREFCKTRGLSSDQVKIVRRNGRVEVEVKIECLIKIAQSKT